MDPHKVRIAPIQVAKAVNNGCMPSNTHTLVAVGALASFFLPSLASAQEACGDTTCDLGTTCEAREQSCPVCPAGQSCTECEPTTLLYCALAECDSDADCADYLTCVAQTERECPESGEQGCRDGETDEECAARATEGCESRQVPRCRARWNQPCQVNADCGGGSFECTETGACVLNDYDPCSEDSDCEAPWQCGRFMIGSCGVDTGQTEEECDQAFERGCVPPSLGLSVNDQAGVEMATVVPDSAESNGDEVSSQASSAGVEAAAGENSGCSLEPRRAGSREGVGSLLALVGFGIFMGRRRASSSRRS